MNDQKPGVKSLSGGATVAAFPWRAVAALCLLAGLGVLCFTMGWQKYVSLDSIVEHYGLVKGFVAQNLIVSLLAFAITYVAAVALSLPVATPLTLGGGLLFGWALATPVIVVSATVGASLMFLIAKSALGGPLRARAGPWLAKLADGFKANALSYMLFLRLVPAFPFVIVNLAPALLGVPFATFFLATMLGIIPGTLAYTIAGEGLGGAVMMQAEKYTACMKMSTTAGGHGPGAACDHTIDVSALVTRELVLAFALMGVLALLPVAIKFWSKHHAEKA